MLLLSTRLTIRLVYQLVFLTVLSFAVASLDHKNTKNECIFGNIDIFIISSASSLPLLSFLLHSIQQFMPCSHGINLFFDRKDIPRARLWTGDRFLNHPIHFRAFDFPDTIPSITNSTTGAPGYILQAWLMMWADRYSNADEVDHILFMDTDSIFALPVTCGSLFDAHGKPYVLSWPMKPFNGHFIGPCRDMIGSECERSYMAMFPFVMPINAFAPMREHIRRKLNPQAQTFDEAFDKWASKGNWMAFSQFVVMGEYLRVYQPHLRHEVFCPREGKDFHASPDHQSCEQFVPVGLHYSYPYQGYLLPSRDDRPNIFNFKHLRLNEPSPFHQHLHFTDKFSPATILLLEEAMQHGYCLQYMLSETTAIGGSTDSFNLTEVGESLGCTEKMFRSVHPIVDLYYGLRPLNWTHVVTTFSTSNHPQYMDRFDGKCTRSIPIQLPPAQ